MQALVDDSEKPKFREDAKIYKTEFGGVTLALTLAVGLEHR